MAKSRMSAVGFSDTKPLIDPADPRSVTMNRRVDVVVLTTLPADQAALLPAAAGADAKLHTGQTTAQAEAVAKATQQADQHDRYDYRHHHHYRARLRRRGVPMATTRRKLRPKRRRSPRRC